MRTYALGLLSLSLALAACQGTPSGKATALADGQPNHDGRAPAGATLAFRDMFNGKDLSGWVPVNVAADTVRVVDGEIRITGSPTGVIRTEKMYDNFILEADWMHLEKGGNSGIFLFGDMTAIKPGQPYPKGLEVQVLENDYGQPKPARWYSSHGDLFPVHGATADCANNRPENKQRAFPLEDRSRPAGQWNHYVVVAVDGHVSLSVNGKFVTMVDRVNPRKGYICLESEGAPVRFRNIRICELPPSVHTAESVASDGPPRK